MDDKLNAQILDKLTKVCICKSITKATIKNSILAGADTVEKIAEDTGATKGSCKGCRCKFKIEELILAHKNEEF